MNGSVSVTGTLTYVVPANTRRRKVIITNNDAANPVWLGQGGVAANNGIYLAAGMTMSDEKDIQGYIYTGAWSAISGGAAVTLSFIEDAP